MLWWFTHNSYQKYERICLITSVCTVHSEYLFVFITHVMCDVTCGRDVYTLGIGKYFWHFNRAKIVIVMTRRECVEWWIGVASSLRACVLLNGLDHPIYFNKSGHMVVGLGRVLGKSKLTVTVCGPRGNITFVSLKLSTITFHDCLAVCSPTLTTTTSSQFDSTSSSHMLY